MSYNMDSVHVHNQGIYQCNDISICSCHAKQSVQVDILLNYKQEKQGKFCKNFQSNIQSYQNKEIQKLAKQ